VVRHPTARRVEAGFERVVALDSGLERGGEPITLVVRVRSVALGLAMAAVYESCSRAIYKKANLGGSGSKVDCGTFLDQVLVIVDVTNDLHPMRLYGGGHWRPVARRQSYGVGGGGGRTGSGGM
jgi:hypothetical protein